MKELILYSLLSAGISSAGTYAVVSYAQPVPSDTSAVTAQLTQMNATLTYLSKLEMDQAANIMAYQRAQALNEDRMLLLGRMIVKSLVGKDPITALQAAQVQ